jgi:membrane protein implicated in regulation of membrane protease activity
MDSLSVTLLFSLGIFFTFLEVILYSFFIIWFGIAFLVVAIIEFFFP